MESAEKLLEDSLLKIWNDRQPESRLGIMGAVYADDIAFYESNESAAIIGHQAINELVGKLQQHWPSAFRFELIRPSQVNHQVQHISWRLGVPGQTPAASGMDIAVIEDGKIKSLHLFLDKV